MDESKQESNDYDKPVAYDVDGQPLYAHPAQSVSSIEADTVAYMTRPVEMEHPFISDSTKVKHDQSVQLYPGLNLSESEYVIIEVRRHIVGVILQLLVGFILVILLLVALLNYDLVSSTLGLTGLMSNNLFGGLMIAALISVICLLTYFTYFIYSNNRFYLTNESVIEQIQLGLFNHKEQTISLGSIEDASYSQESLIEEMIDYGSIRLSTIGDETTYRFKFVANPKQAIDTLNTAVELFKNGRPVVIRSK